MKGFTKNQREAILARGNVLVAAGAGSGKTRTLVQRAIEWLKGAPSRSIDRVLMVTFTEAAAAEMRARLRGEILRESQNGETQRWLEQAALLEDAAICTIHSLCLRMIREHFYSLQLDPRSGVLDSAEAALLARRVLKDLMEGYFAAESEATRPILQFLEETSGRFKRGVEEILLQLHEYRRSLPAPEAWLEDQSALLKSREPAHWKSAFFEALRNWAAQWLPVIDAMPSDLANLAPARNIRKDLAHLSSSGQEPYEALERINQEFAPKPWGGRKGKIDPWLKPLQKESKELAGLLAPTGCSDFGGDPFCQDWEWSRRHLSVLLRMLADFSREYEKVKRSQGTLDFADLEQLALDLLLGCERRSPTPAAQEWRNRFDLVCVDEYQDINAAQDAILAALSRTEGAANRFLVGDVKQSIYRFRLADPSIFRKYARDWRSAPHSSVIPLSENFRCHEGILHFVNDLFEKLMRSEVGGVAYDSEARLGFGERDGAGHLQFTNGCSFPPVEIHLLPPFKKEAESPEEDETDDLSEAEREAAVVLNRIQQLEKEGFPIKDAGQFRPLRWKDVVILLRSPKGKANAFARVFAQAGVPLLVARGGFFQAIEVLDLCSLLQLLDNPVQDVPLLAVLRSPFGGFTCAELARIRLAAGPELLLWPALQRLSEQTRGAVQDQELIRKAASFVGSYEKWRAIIRRKPLSEAIQIILRDACYEPWLDTQPQSVQAQANLKRFLGMARRFDAFEQQGLYRFLRFLEARDEAELEENAAAIDTGNSVRLLSIHLSKGLEFPIVILPCLSKKFNTQDLYEPFLLDETLGICPTIVPPGANVAYESAAFWAASRHLKRELLGEEARLLYVAMTRACQKLVCVAAAKQDTLEETIAPGLEVHTLLHAANVWKWVAPHIEGIRRKHPGLIQLSIHDNPPEITPASAQATAGAPESDPASLLPLFQRRYAWTTHTETPAKASVSQIRKMGADPLEESVSFFHKKPAGRRRAAEAGTAHHAFLECMELRPSGGLLLREQAEELLASGILTREEAALLDFQALEAFWSSPEGRYILEEAGNVHRELPFTARFRTSELPGSLRECGKDFMIVQGMVDLAVLKETEIWILDFKTDQISAGEIPERAEEYRLQLDLYAKALERIYRKPVTKRWLCFLRAGKTISL